ncbi:MAG: type II toxin-antitoxin system RelE/ParE family toxin [Caulobacterales bacterium]|jgi:toxin ParE1/3/4|nr:type II toxin-antitoxin system RelE/ParE family toxin [Caulobacterales bacterium]
MKIVWRPQARAELLSIAAYIARESPSGAARVQSQILHSVELLETWPRIGRKGRRGYRELVVPHTNYVVIFRLTRANIEIVRMLHTSQRR